MSGKSHCFYQTPYNLQHNAIHIGIRVWTRWAGTRIPADVTHLLFFENAQTASEGPPSLLRNGHRWLIPRSYSVPGGGFHHAHPSNVEFGNDWNCNSIPTVNAHGTNKEKFTIALFRLQALSLLLETTFMALVKS
jgi:hypothetical protein